MKSFSAIGAGVRAGVPAARPRDAAPFRAVLRRGDRLHRRAPADRRHRRARRRVRPAASSASRPAWSSSSRTRARRAWRCRVRGFEAHSSLTPQRRQRRGDRLRDRRLHRGMRARDFRDARRPGRRLRRAVHDRPRRHDPRRHGAQHRAARLHVRVRDPPPAVRRSGRVLRRGASVRRDASCRRCTRSPRTPASSSTELSRCPASTRSDGSAIAALGHACNGTHDVNKVSFGTEASLFHSAGIPTIICGPGHIAQAHQPNEWVALEQVAQCEAFMRRLVRARLHARERGVERDDRAADRSRVSRPRALARPATPASPTSGASRRSAPGPRVTIQALTHGNEVCGAIANDWLLRESVRPVRGTLTLTFANVDGVPALRCRRPVRVALRGRGLQPAVDRRRAGRAAADARSRARARAAPGLRRHRLPARPAFDDRPVPAAGARGTAAARDSSSRSRSACREHIIIDAGHAAGKRLRDYGGVRRSRRSAQRAAGRMRPALGARGAAMSRSSRRCASCAISACSTPAFLDAHLDRAPLPPQRAIEITDVVTITTDEFAFAQPVRGPDRHRPSAARCSRATARRRPHALRRRVLIMPTRRPRKGETAVRIGRRVS